jgi:predicted RNA-binding Zn ribbon-like protein
MFSMVIMDRDGRSNAHPGALALSFANIERITPDREHASPGVEPSSPTRLAAWLTDCGALDPSTGPTLALPVLRGLHGDAVRLHRAVHTLLHAVAEERELDAVTLFEMNRVLAAAAWHRRLETDAQGGAIVESVRPSAPLGLLAPIAAAAAELVAAGPGGRLRTCASPECARWFLDTSKGGRRRWCSMATCGNRAKAARWRERHVSDG